MNLFRIEPLVFLFMPGFAITFLIGLLRSGSRPHYLKIALWATLVGAVSSFIVCGALDAAFISMMGPREVDRYATPLTVEQARQEDCPIPLPDSARKVQFVVASGGLQALEILVRFEAPVEVCKSHVQTVFEMNDLHKGFPRLDRLLVPLDRTPPPEVGDMVGKAPWFDIDKIAHGLKAGNGSVSYEPQFWVDEDRGAFYCKITD